MMDYMSRPPKRLKGSTVILLDHEDVPYVCVGMPAEIVESRYGYVGVVVRDYDGTVIRYASARHDGVLRLDWRAVRFPSPLELLGLAAEDSPEDGGDSD